jgi:tetratricopeptide (TPR) repeat protein
MPRSLIVAVVLASSLAFSGGSSAEDCGQPYDSPGHYGPFDYTDPSRKENLHLVEMAHFTTYMEELALSGFSSLKPKIKEELPGGEIVVPGNFDYTLKAFPNHHRALYAMGMYQLRHRKASMAEYQQLLRSGHAYTAECYFARAIMFKPDDGMVHHAYGAFLHKAGQLREAEEQYLAALATMPNAPEPHYDLGLLYIDLHEYDKAEAQAKAAYDLGYPLPGLRRKLDRVRGRAE